MLHVHDLTIPKFLHRYEDQDSFLTDCRLMEVLFVRFVFRNPKKDPGKNKPTTVLGKRNVYRLVDLF